MGCPEVGGGGNATWRPQDAPFAPLANALRRTYSSSGRTPCSAPPIPGTPLGFPFPRSTTMAEAACPQAQEEAEPAARLRLVEKVDYKDVNVRGEVHLRPWQNPCPACHPRATRAEAPRDRQGRQEERAGRWPCGRSPARPPTAAGGNANEMKLILTQEVTGLGTPGDVVEVKDGAPGSAPSRAPRSSPSPGPKGGKITNDPRCPLVRARSSPRGGAAGGAPRSSARPSPCPQGGRQRRLFGAIPTAECRRGGRQGRRPQRAPTRSLSCSSRYQVDW